MALHVPKAPGFAQMLKEGAMVSVSLTPIVTIHSFPRLYRCVLAPLRSRRSRVP